MQTATVKWPFLYIFEQKNKIFLSKYRNDKDKILFFSKNIIIKN